MSNYLRNRIRRSKALMVGPYKGMIIFEILM
jgi:hypothetical protein